MFLVPRTHSSPSLSVYVLSLYILIYRVLLCLPQPYVQDSLFNKVLIKSVKCRYERNIYVRTNVAISPYTGNHQEIGKKGGNKKIKASTKEQRKKGANLVSN